MVGVPESEASSPISALFSRLHSNKESDPEKYALKLKLHQGGVRRCQYSGDGSKVVSCSVEGDVKVRSMVGGWVSVVGEWVGGWPAACLSTARREENIQRSGTVLTHC